MLSKGSYKKLPCTSSTEVTLALEPEIHITLKFKHTGMQKQRFVEYTGFHILGVLIILKIFPDLFFKQVS